MTGGRTISWLLIPPVIYRIFFGLGVLLDRAVPWSPGWLEDELDRMVFVIAGVSLEVISISYLTWRRTTVIPHGSPSYLVPGGPYLISRNLTYIVLTAAYFGGAILLASNLAAGASDPAADDPRQGDNSVRRSSFESRVPRPYDDYHWRVRRWL